MYDIFGELFYYQMLILAMFKKQFDLRQCFKSILERKHA